MGTNGGVVTMDSDFTKINRRSAKNPWKRIYFKNYLFMPPTQELRSVNFMVKLKK
jgi:hypothetical protein